MNVLGKLGFKRRLRPWRKARSQSLLFQWANSELKAMYQEGLKSLGYVTRGGQAPMQAGANAGNP